MQNKIKFYHYKRLRNLKHLHQLQNYLDQRVWFTQLCEFNDPFEGRSIYKPYTSNEILENKDIFKRYFEFLRKTHPALSEDDFRKELSSPEAAQMMTRGIVNNFFEKHGFLCLTKSYSNIPMWGHYSDNHRGYCIEFELNLDLIYEICQKGEKPFQSHSDFTKHIRSIIDPRDDEEQEFLPFNNTEDEDKHFAFFKISYKNNYPELKEEIFDKKKKEDIEDIYELEKYFVLNSVGVKFREWQYEQEYRLLSNGFGKNNGLMNLRGYPFLKVTGIIMGERLGENVDKDIEDFIRDFRLQKDYFSTGNMAEQLKNFIMQRAKFYNVRAYAAKCSKTSYEIEISDYFPEHFQSVAQVDTIENHENTFI